MEQINASAMDTESKEYGARVINSSDEEDMGRLAKEAAQLEQELGINSDEKEAQVEAAQKEQEADAPKVVDYVNKIGEFVKSSAEHVVAPNDTTFTQAAVDVARGGAGGVVDFAQGVGNTLIDGVNYLEKFAQNKGIDINVMPDDAKLTFGDKFLPPKNPAEQMIRKLSEYLIPFAGATKAVKVGNALVKGAKVSGASALISAATVDPDDKRLSDMVKDVHWMPEFAVGMADFLASKPGDTRAESRFKTFAESLAVDATLSAALFGITKATKISKDAYRGVKTGVKPPVAEVAEEGAEAGAKAVAKAKPEKILGPDGKPIPSPRTKLREMIGPKPTEKVVAKLRDAQTADAMMEALREAPTAGDNVENLIQSAKRGVQTDEVVRKNAEQILANRSKVEELIQREAGKPLNAEELTATRMLWEREFLSLQNLRIKDVANASPEELMLFQEQFGRFMGVGAQVKGASAELGRGLRTLQQAVEAAPDDAARLAMMNKYMDLNGGPETIKDIASVFNTVMDMKPEDMVEQAMKLQRKSLTMRVGDGLAQMWVEGVFWSPKTQAANLIGNAMSVMDNVASTAVGALIPVSEKGIMKGEVAASLRGMWQGMIEGYGALKTYMKEGALESTVSKFGRIEQAVRPEVFGIDETSWLGKAVQNMGYANSLGLRATVASDIMFRHINYRSRIHQLLTREGVQKGLMGDALKSHLASTLGDVPEHIHRAAQAFAEKSIWAQPLDNVAFGQTIEKMGQVAESIPMGRAVFPFLRFGGNMADYMMQRTPGLSYISPEFRSAMRAGGARKQEALAKLALGTSLIGMGGYMASTGTLTGSGPKDYQSRKALSAGDTGWQPYTIRYDDGTSVAINRLTPHGIILSMGADIAEMIGALDDDTKDAQFDLIGAATGIFGTYFTPAVVEDFGDFFGTAKDIRQGADLGTAATKSMARFLTGMQPLSGLTKEVGKLVNDNQKFDTTPDGSGEKKYLNSVWKIWEATKNEWLATTPIPGFSDGLPPQINMFGEPVHYPPGVGSDLVSPIFSNKPEDNIARAEMERLGVKGPFIDQTEALGQDVLHVTMPDRYITKELGQKAYQIRLDPHQYHRYVQLSAGIDLVDNEGTKWPPLKEALTDQIVNQWPEATSRRDESGDITDAAKIVLIKNMVSNYRKIAREQMYKEFPELADKLQEYGEARSEALGVGDE